MPSAGWSCLEPNGSVRNVQIKKEEGLDLGLNFDTYLMDESAAAPTTVCSALWTRCPPVCARPSILRTTMPG